jgi:transposase
MKNRGRIFGCDIGSKFIILHDGKTSYKISNIEELQTFLNITPNDIFVLEQTGAYGIRWAEIFTSFGSNVYIVDGKDFKNYRLSRNRKKDDTIDAFYLRKYFLDREKRQKCRKYNPRQIHIRALIRQHIRNEKDITKHINRLKQYLAYIFYKEDYYNLSRAKFLKKLDEIEQKLKASPHTLNELALAELQKLKISLRENERLEQEIISIAKNHPDYQLLKSFPIGDIQIATLIAYSYNIKNFPTKDKYIAYVLMGSNLEQSGISVYKVKTDKARTEIKGIFYTLYMQAHRKTKNWTHPLKPLTQFVKELVNTSYNFKKRYIKFLSRFLELTYYARKHKLTYTQSIELLLNRLMEEKENIKKKIEKDEATNIHFLKLSRINSKINTLNEMLKLAPQRQDIPSPQFNEAQELEQEGEGQLVYMCGQNNKEKKGEVKEDDGNRESEKDKTQHTRKKRNNKRSSKRTSGKKDIPNDERNRGSFG